MRLGSQTRLFLELATIIGLETLEAVLYAPLLFKGMSGGRDSDFDRRFGALRERGLVTAASGDANASGWTEKLSEQASEALSDGIDPRACWDSAWDGKWRVFAFDLIRATSGQRQALRLWLKRRRFGRLQGSVWVTPRHLGNWSQQIAELGVGPNAAVFVEGPILGDRSDTTIAARGWELTEVNDRYLAYSAFLDQGLPSQGNLVEWQRRESQLWNAAFELDPFLPRELWPKDFARSYLGPAAFDRRRTVYLSIGESLVPERSLAQPDGGKGAN